ncbi:MAG: TlpA disulfide reductase family protein [Gammaproteobacteria bacterium]
MLRNHGRARLAIVAAVALAAGLAAFLASREFAGPERIAEPEAPKPAVIPELRPDVTLADREGRLRSLSEWDGKPVVINFWATWCAPCRREIPMLNALARDLAAEGIQVIGIAIDFRDEVLRYLESTPIDYTVLIGEQDGMAAARAFGMVSIGLPFTAFTDSQARIAAIHVGELHRREAEVILSAVRAVDAGQITLSEARTRIQDGLASNQSR